MSVVSRPTSLYQFRAQKAGVGHGFGGALEGRGSTFWGPRAQPRTAVQATWKSKRPPRRSSRFWSNARAIPTGCATSPRRLDGRVLLPVLKDRPPPLRVPPELRCADLPRLDGQGDGWKVVQQLRERVGSLPAALQPVADEVDFERSTIILKSRAEEILRQPERRRRQRRTLRPAADGAFGEAPRWWKGAPATATAGGPAAGDRSGSTACAAAGARAASARSFRRRQRPEDERRSRKPAGRHRRASERFARLHAAGSERALRLKHPAVVRYRVIGRVADSDPVLSVAEFVPGPSAARQAAPHHHRRTSTGSARWPSRLAQGPRRRAPAGHRPLRDLAPDNVVVKASADLSEATLIDFGIALSRRGRCAERGVRRRSSRAAPEQFEFEGGKLEYPSIIRRPVMPPGVRGKPLQTRAAISRRRGPNWLIVPLLDIPERLRPLLTALPQPDPPTARRPWTMSCWLFADIERH